MIFTLLASFLKNPGSKKKASMPHAVLRNMAFDLVFTEVTGELQTAKKNVKKGPHDPSKRGGGFCCEPRVLADSTQRAKPAPGSRSV